MRNLVETQEAVLRSENPRLVLTRIGYEYHLVNAWDNRRTRCGRDVAEDVPWPKEQDAYLCSLCVRSALAELAKEAEDA